MKTRSKVTSNSLKSISKDMGMSSRGDTLHLHSGGRNKLPVKIGKDRRDDKNKMIVSHEIMVGLDKWVIFV